MKNQHNHATLMFPMAFLLSGFAILVAVIAFGALSGCAATRAIGPSPDAPDWTKQQCSIRHDYLYAVGSSNFRDPIARRDDAGLSALSALATCFAGTLAQQETAGGTEVTSAAQAELTRGSSMVNYYWVDPNDGVEYALASMRIE